MTQHHPRRPRSTRGLVAPARRRSTRLVVAVAALALVVTAGVAAQPSSAQAAAYPSWADVLAAQGNADAKAAEVATVQALLQQLSTDLDAKNADAVAKGAAYEEAQTAYDQADYKLGQLQQQADEASDVAAASEERAGQLAAQLGRSGGTDISSSLIADPGDAGQLLYKIGAMSKLTEQADGIYSQATQDRNTAQSLSDQADVAAKALAVLAADAQTALAAANDAAAAAADAVAEQQANQSTLQAQLATLQTDVLHTKEEFEKGEAERKAAEAAAAAVAARLGSPTNGTPTGVVSSSGWTRPAGGNISSGFGMRVNPVTHAYILHAGTDLAAGCGTPIFAAASGTVSYAGWYGGYGNFVLLDNGGGITTGYGHQPNGGITVGVGQHVEVGQQIGHVGSTGNSTGCHLHFETRVGGTPANPVDFMSQRGIRL